MTAARHRKGMLTANRLYSLKLLMQIFTISFHLRINILQQAKPTAVSDHSHEK